MIDYKNLKIAVIGLGYVGLPLAVEFAKQRSVVGFDIDVNRIKNLKKGLDSTLEVTEQELSYASQLEFTSKTKHLADCNCYIITVPTPVTKAKKPNFTSLTEASKTVASILSKGDIVIYESTVYPGATEEVCVPLLEIHSKLKFNSDFFVGYSPERINPGDKSRKITDIVKVTSGSTHSVAETVDNLYKSIIKAGTFKTSSIRIAEAAKVIENTQRDINIALINELAMIFEILKIDTEEVLEAAGSKWNFLPFRPGLVGGHCIGVDPYYLTYKAQMLGYDPEIIIAGRKINDGMGAYVANNLIKHMCKKSINMSNAKILIMGFSFKENCPDIRNTKVYSLYKELKEFSLDVDVYDPWIDKEETKKLYGVNIINSPNNEGYDAIILAVGHNEFKTMGFEGISRYLKSRNVVYDLKHILERKEDILRL